MNDESPDVTSYESYKAFLDDMTSEERESYWKQQDRAENVSLLNSLNHNIALNNQIIQNTQRWLKEMVEDYTSMVAEPDEAYTTKLKESLALGAELIEGCEADTARTNAEIAHYIRYPLYSEKRRQWYKTKEGQLWLEKIKKQLKKS